MSEPADPQSLLTEPRRAALARLGFVGVPESLEALLPALARGHHVALLAGEGSGKEAVYAVAAGARCDPASPEVQALVLAPTGEAARRAARAAHLLNRETALEALVWPPDGEAEGPHERPVAHLLAGRPEPLLREVRSGRLSLAGLRLLVVDGVEAIRAAGGWQATEALLDSLGGEGQKIVSALVPDESLERLIEGRLPRARRWPPELLAPRGSKSAAQPGASAPALHVGAGAGEEERLEILARGLRGLAAETGRERAFVHCAGPDIAHRVAATLAAAGLRLSEEPGEPGVAVAWGDDEEPPRGEVAASFGLPPGLPDLRRWLGEAAARLAVVEAAHLPQLELLARRAGWRTLGSPPAAEAERDAVARFRERVRREVEATDAGAELLLLEPLLDAHGPVRVAAALARIVRRAGGGPAGPRVGVDDRGVRPAWTRIFVNVGKKDGAGPGDLVGAITGETGATGAQIGKIEVRSTFSLVDVDSQIADEVIRALRGKTIRNREVVARPERPG